MDNKKLKVWIWILIILSVINISSIATILYQRYSSQPVATYPYQNNPEFRGFGKGMGKHGMKGRHGHRGFRCQDLSEEQRMVFRKYRNAFRDKAFEIKTQMYENRAAFVDEMLKEHPDTLFIDQLITEHGKLHKQMKKHTFETYGKIRDELGPDKAKELEGLFRMIMKHQDRPRGRGQY